MIVRQRKTAIPRHIVFNVAGGFLLFVGLVLALRASFTKEEMPLCEARYKGGILFSLARSTGAPLTSEDLQARLGGLDWGLVTNTRIVGDSAVPYGHALEVDLKGAGGRSDDEQTRGGMGFTWLPRQLASSVAACLSYSVWAATDFKPGEGGILPGLLSETPSDSAPATAQNGQPGEPAQLQPFSTRPQWRGDGSLVIAHALNVGQRGLYVLDASKAALKPGRWVRMEQEVVLNTPGRADGIMRMWVDGKLVLERSDVGYRSDEVQSFLGVSGDIHHIKNYAWAAAPSDTKLRLSPLELRLR